MDEKKKLDDKNKDGLYPSEEDTVCSPEFPEGCLDVETGEEEIEKLKEE